jgi:hypothetical protein
VNNLKFYDLEIYPEWWCAVVSEEEPSYKSIMYSCRTDREEELYIKSRMRVYTSDDLTTRDDLERFKSDMKKGVISGYNNKRYDNILLKCAFLGFSPEKMYIASELIMDPSNMPTILHHRVAEYIKSQWSECYATQDFMDDSFKGLKDKEASYGIDVRECPIPFGKKNLTPKEKAIIVEYCKHDVYALHVHYSSVAKAYVDTKVQLTEIFDLPLPIAYRCTNAVLSGKVLDAVRVHGTTIKDPTITIRNTEVRAYFEKYIPKDTYQHLLKKCESKSFTIFGNKVDTGDGGLHSVLLLPKQYAPNLTNSKLPALHVKSTDTHVLLNVDASSCYTSVMIYFDAIGRGIKNPKRLIEIYQRRMKLKATPKSEWAEKDKYFVNAAKLVLNTTYGAMGNEYLPLYDDYMRSKTCRIGQMVLIALANAFYTNIPNIKIIQTNTDGILVYVERKYVELLNSLVKEFSDISRFIFDVEEDKAIWQLNVNNYVAIDIKDKMKDKGGAFVHDIHQPGHYHIRPLSNYCIPKAQINYYRTGECPVTHLLNNDKVSDFITTGTKGPSYYEMCHQTSNGEIPVGKVSRLFAVKDESLGLVVKKKWAEVKPNAAQKRAGTTVSMLLEEYRNKGKQLKQENGVWKAHQIDKVSLCPPHALIVNDALYNYHIENKRLIHEDGRSWEIDYGYYCGELDRALNEEAWMQLIDEKLEVTKRFNLI